MCVCVCLYVEPVSRSKDCVRSRMKIGSVVCLYTPVSPSVPKMEGINATGGILFLRMYFDGVYIPCIYSHARWSYRRRFRSLLLCPLSVERYYFPLFVDSARVNTLVTLLTTINLCTAFPRRSLSRGHHHHHHQSLNR